MNGRASLSGKPYSAGVRIANWNEDTYLEEDLLKDFLYKREKGELLIQKSRRLKNNLLKQMQLSVSKDGFIHFGDTVMLLSPENKKSPTENYSAACGNLTLAVNPDDITVHTSESLQVPCGVSAVKSVNPVGRNAFHILSVEGNSMGEPIRFGQNFGLGATGGFTDQMANTKVLITHCHTNRGLAVPRNYCLRSYFGKEYEVICHTYLDSHKAEEDKNYWLIVTANPSDDGITMFDRPKPPSEETRERERNELYAGT
ncbi:cilia- and flagella-associated protein 161 isoform X2 [Lepidochelys kempii]|uniref:cilia- and flagella-associated protein 161 isoform X2 n=1 Tax=Lepidochelys kempii TaxID=8472 RepID=UPI003C6F3040